MNRTTIIAIISLFALLLSQGYWLHTIYTDFKEKEQLVFNNLFEAAINNEVGIRFSDEPKDPDNLSYTFKKASDMSPEEIDSLNAIAGDTVNLDEAMQANIGTSLTEVVTQYMQDMLMTTKPIHIEMMDTLFYNALAEKHIQPAFSISLYDQNYKEIKQVDHGFEKDKPYLLTRLKPIGTKGLLYVQAKVALPPYVIFQKMLYAFLVSLFIICIMFYCVAYQLVVIRRTRRQLKEREESVYSAIHDLKKPLNGVFGLLDFMQGEAKDNSILQIFKNGKKQIRKLTETIESMLGDLKEEYQRVILNKTEVDLPEMIEQIEKELRPSFQKKNYIFEIANPGQIQTIYTDAVRLERCLRNLIENALKYSDPDVIVKVIISSTEKGISLAIQDNGWGIPEKEKKRIGKQFFRVKHTGKPSQEGYGIGLNSVKRLVRELGGKFRFESREGIGSTFFIILPQVE